MNLLLGALMISFTALLSGLWARANHVPELRRLLPVMSISLIFEALSMVQSAMLRRSMDFKSLAIRTNLSAVAGGVTGIVMALTGSGPWALVGQQLVRDFLAVLLLWRLGSWRPHLEFSFTHLKELLSFSLHNFVAQLGIFTDLQAAPVLLGLFFGPVAVGLYRLADRLMNSVVVMSTTSIQAVSLPEFSRLQDQPEGLHDSALACIRLSASVTIPALAGLAAVSRPLMAMLGASWIPATNALRVLCVLGMTVVLSFFTGPLLQAIGKTRQLAILEWARVLIGVGFLIGLAKLVQGAGVNWQVTGIALARFLPSVFVVTPIFLHILMRYCHLRVRDLISAIGPSLLSGLGVVLSVTAMQQIGVVAATRPMVMLAVYIFVGGVAGVGILIAMDRVIRGAVNKMFASLVALSGF
jgi:PST family polysaccharide transporter